LNGVVRPVDRTTCRQAGGAIAFGFCPRNAGYALEMQSDRSICFERARLQPLREVLSPFERPPGAEAQGISRRFSARLKPCPFKTKQRFKYDCPWQAEERSGQPCFPGETLMLIGTRRQPRFRCVRSAGQIAVIAAGLDSRRRRPGPEPRPFVAGRKRGSRSG
jgi:hypothetical protein